MDIRLIAFDLDGTLLQSGSNSVSHRNRAALEQAALKGIHIVPVTGRCGCIIPPQVLELNCVRYVIASNGGSAFDKITGMQLFNGHLTKEETEIAYNILRGRDMFIEFHINNNIAVDRYTFDNLDSFDIPRNHRSYIESGKALILPSLEEYIHQGAKDIEKINLPRTDPLVREVVWKMLCDTGRLKVTSSLFRNIEINRLDVDKGTALKQLCNRLKIPMESVAAFGDGGNDIEMLKAAGIGIAMCNAVPKAKEAADQVTLGNNEDGIAVFLEKHL